MSMSTNQNYLVQIIQYGAPGSAPTRNITAPIPESVNFELNAEYTMPFPQSIGDNSKLIRMGSQLMGMKLAVQALTAQLWAGSTTGDLSFALEFFTESDPETDVRQPVLNLMKLVTPSISQEGLMFSPGPQLDFTQLGAIAVDGAKNFITDLGTVGLSAFKAAKNVGVGAYNQLTGKTPTTGTMSSGETQTASSTSAFSSGALKQNPQLGTAEYWKNQVTNRIQIRLGNYLFFDNVVVTHIGNVFTSNFDAQTGLPHHVVVQVNFRPMFTLTQEDLDNVFLNVTQNSDSDFAGAFGFSIPDSVSGASTLGNQFLGTGADNTPTPTPVTGGVRTYTPAGLKYTGDISAS